MDDSTLDAVTQAYAALDANPAVELDNTFITPASPEPDPINNQESYSFDAEHCEFIAKLYELYFIAKVIHWNISFNRALHTDSDEFIKILEKFIDDFVELSLANINPTGFTAVNPLTFLTSISNVVKISIKWITDKNPNGILGIYDYTTLIEQCIMLLTTTGQSIVNNSTDTDSKKLAKTNLIDDTIEKLTKLLYLSMKL